MNPSAIADLDQIGALDVRQAGVTVVGLSRRCKIDQDRLARALNGSGIRSLRPDEISRLVPALTQLGIYELGSPE